MEDWQIVQLYWNRNQDTILATSEKYGNYCRSIARNLSINRYKHDTANKRGGGKATIVLDELMDIVSDSDNAEQIVDRNELIKAILYF